MKMIPDICLLCENFNKFCKVKHNRQTESMKSCIAYFFRRFLPIRRKIYIEKIPNLISLLADLTISKWEIFENRLDKMCVFCIHTIFREYKDNFRFEEIMIHCNNGIIPKNFPQFLKIYEESEEIADYLFDIDNIPKFCHHCLIPPELCNFDIENPTKPKSVMGLISDQYPALNTNYDEIEDKMYCAYQFMLSQLRFLRNNPYQFNPDECEEKLRELYKLHSEGKLSSHNLI